MAAFRELQRNPQWGMKPVGFLDDDPRLKGKTVSGVPVVGGFESLETSLERSGALGIAISTAKIPAERVQLIRQLAQRSSVAVYRFEIRFDSDAEAKPGGVVPAENRP